MSVTEEMKHELSDERPYAWIVHNARSGLRTLAFDTSERDRAIKAGGYVTPVWATASQAGRAPSPEPTEAEVEAAAQAIYDATDPLSGDSIATVIISSDHLFPQKQHLEGNGTSKAYQLAAMDVCRTAARAALIAASRSRPAEANAGMVKPDRDSIRILNQFAGMYRSGAQGADMEYDAAQALALAIDDVLSALEPVAEAKAEPVDLTELLEWRDHDSQSEITYTGFGPYMVERLAEDRFRAWFPDEAQVARIMVEGFAGRSEARNACQNDLDGRRALRLVRECAPFLYPGETPLQRIERERKDVDRLLSALAAAKEAKATPVPPVAQQRDEVIEECAKAALGDQVNDRRAADPDHPDSDYAAGRVDAAAAIRALSPERKDQSNG